MQATEEWRAVINYIDENPKIVVSKEEIEKPRPLKQFDETQHKALNAELKFLYTAITRAKCNLWIYDDNPDKRGPVFYYFQKRGLVTVLSIPPFFGQSGNKVSMELIFPKTSSMEEWKQRGNDFRNKRKWDMAEFCYEKAGMDELAKEMKAYSNMGMAKKKDKKYNYLQATFNFLRIFDKQPLQKWIDKAAICLFNACEYDLAASLFLKLCKVRVLIDT